MTAGMARVVSPVWVLICPQGYLSDGMDGARVVDTVYSGGDDELQAKAACHSPTKNISVSAKGEVRRLTGLFSERHHPRRRGWSARLIRELLSVPDVTRDHYRGMVRLWREDRVVEAENHPAFLSYQCER